MQRSAHVTLAGIVAVLASAEWLRSGGAPAWAVIAVAAGVAGAALGMWPPRRLPDVAAAAGALLLSAVVGRTALEVRSIQCCWTELRERRLEAASGALQQQLHRAAAEARRLAERAADAADLQRSSAFAALARAAGAPRPEQGVIVLGPDGEPWAWAGRHRTVPPHDTAELRARITPFYVVFEARRQTAAGGAAVGSVLLAAMPQPGDPHASLATAFAVSHGVTVRLVPPAAALPPDAFAYTTPAGDTLFRVQLAPPGQGDAKLRALRGAGGRVTAVAVALLAVLLIAAPPGRWRWAVLVVTMWAAARAAPSPGTPFAGLFSPATFFRSVLGDLSASAPVLALTAFVALVGGWQLWRRGLRRTRWGMAGAAVLLVAAPYLVRYLARGIAPPASGVDIGLWLSWQVAIAGTAMALVLWAAALVRGRDEPARTPATVPLAIGWAAAAAVLGLLLWGPANAWPEWYTYLWLPALVGAVVPAPRRAALVALAAVAGSAAALVTWGAAVEGRLALAWRDSQRLGAEGDPVAVALLERLGYQSQVDPAPGSAGELYRFWTESPLAAQDYPAVLGLWEADGGLLAEVRLAPLDLPPALLAALARSATDGAGWRMHRLARVPGVHYVLVAPLASGERLVVGVGPRTRLLPPDRVARFLRGEPAVEPPYAIALSPPDLPATADPNARFWTRTGWTVRGERRLELPGGPRHVHVRVDIGEFGTLLVRGALVVLVNLALVALAWLACHVVAEGWRPRLPPVGALVRASYRTRLTAALIAFFGVPLLAFALWSFARLGDEARRTGDLLVHQALRDAALAGGRAALDAPTSERAREIVALGRVLDADLWLYDGPRLTGASAPVLDELGLVDALLDPAVFRRLGFEDELELTADGRAAGRPLRVGYRVVRAGPPDALVVLAAPQLLDDERVRRQQEDLALALILATIAGMGAAVVLAARVARGLERPVAALRVAAEAVGRGRAPPPFPAEVPAEFTTVVTAFERMADDVRRSQAAIEEARERMARVLANVATGVIAVDAELRVTLANAQAAELLGTSIAPGDRLDASGGGAWAPVWAAVARYLGDAPTEIAEREFEIAGRQIRVQMAPLGPATEGCVVALDDTTELSRAARVLAWGEMARQVAHEIKNPLTPIRLGIQHLQRARRGAGDFDRTLTETAGRILAEIDRLDAIARAFSRFGAPGAGRPPLEPVDLHAVARDVVQLYTLGGKSDPGRTRFAVEGAPGRPALARRDEVKEVLVNLLENACQAGARAVDVRIEEGGTTLVVADDGRGVAPDAVSRVFEPAFSTTSSGSGLGLAIARRLVEDWGGEIGLRSEPGGGTDVWLRLRPAMPAA